MTDGMAYLEAHMQSFKESDDRRDNLFREMAVQLQVLDRELKAKCRDYDNERKFRHHWQEETENLERKLSTLQTDIDNGSFVQVLIDGDAAYFHDAFVKAGAIGASEAAHNLLTEVKSHVHSLNMVQEIPIFVTLYANVGGLGGKLAHLGLTNNPTDFYTFIRAFNSSQPLFNFVDVGSGKEKADHKLREMFRLCLANKQCKNIIFGGCHDNGYLTILEQYKHDVEKATRITLLETMPAQAGFYALNFKMARFPSVFRAEPLERTPFLPSQQYQHLSAIPNGHYSSLDLAKIPPTAVKGYEGSTQTQLSVEVPTPPASTPASTPKVTKTKTATPVSTASTWASAAVANGVADKTITVSRKKPTIQRNILYTYDGYRVDHPLPPSSSHDISNLHAIMEKGKLCNEHFLKGKCSASKCNYLHTGKLSAGELNALRHKARKISCPNKIGCDDYGCYCGHVCPYERNGKCTKDNCNFLDVHGIDRTPAYKHYEDGRTEELEY